MDFMDDYGSSSDNEENDDGEEGQDEEEDEEEVISKKRQRLCVGAEEDPGTVSSKAGSVEIVRIDLAPCGLLERSKPHVRGNWAGHVVIAVNFEPNSDKEQLWRDQVYRMTNEFGRLLGQSGWSGTVLAHKDLHVSLSRPFYLQLSSIDSFVKELTKQVEFHEEFLLELEESRPILLCNDEKTRSFWCVPLVCSPMILKLLECVDDVMLKYKAERFYQPPMFHVSVASVPGRVPDKFSELSLDDSDEDDGVSYIHVGALTCTFGGTKRYDIPLQKW